jgi:hypothetical protein
MGAKSRDSVERLRGALAEKAPDVSRATAAPVRSGRGAEGDIADSFRRARGAIGDVARDIKQLRGRAGSFVKKTKSPK